MASNKSRWDESRSVAIISAASSSVKFSIPCCVLKWNLTQTRSPESLYIEYVWEPNPCIWRKSLGIPLSDIKIVTWCNASGRPVQKSQLFCASLIFVLGSRFTARFKLTNNFGSLKKNTGVLFPTKSQFPSSV